MAKKKGKHKNGENMASCAAMPEARPLPAKLAEFGVMYERLMAMERGEGLNDGRPREITVTVSEASLVFMAWLDSMIQWRDAGGLRPCGLQFDANEQETMDRAVHYLEAFVPWSLDRDFQMLCLGRHPVLCPPEQDEAGDL